MLSSVPFLSLVLLPIMGALKTTATPTPATSDMDLAERRGQLVLSEGSAVDTVQPLTPDALSLIDPCIKWSDCSACLTSDEGKKNKCRWSQVTFECTQTGASPDKVAGSAACALMAQMQQAFPQTTEGGKVTKKAGVVPKAYLDSFASIQHHVFDGESTDPNSGRHLLSTFLAVHKGAKPIDKNDNNSLQQFSTGSSNVKTVWVDSGDKPYTRLDIQNICVTADKLLNGRDGGGTVGIVVQSHFSFPACITYSTFQGHAASCFPIGVFGPPPAGKKGAKVGELCVGSVPL